MAAEGNIRAIGRGLKVLQAINQQGPLSMMAIAKLADLPYPTACRIVETLVAERMIEREATRKYYRPTALVKTLSSGYQQEDDLGRISRQHIIKLTRDLRWPISICTRVGMSMMIRESTHTIAPFTLNIYHRGYTMPLLGSSSGKVCLAYSDAGDREMVLGQIRSANTPNAERVVERLDAELEAIRIKGYGYYDRIRHTANPGKTSAISVPVLADGVCKATLTLAFFSSSMAIASAVESYLPDMKRAASAIRDELVMEQRAA